MPVLIYRYDASPFSVKIDNVLLLKKISHQKVNVANMLPRPEITELLADFWPAKATGGPRVIRVKAGWRNSTRTRTRGHPYPRPATGDPTRGDHYPIVAIGNDIYCDTSLIASALERRFPAARGYGTLFPNKKHGGDADTGLIKAFAKHWADTVLFPLAPALLPWEKMPPAFIKDRSTLRGPIDVDAIVASRGKALSLLSTHLSLVEEQLSDGREWLFDTELPSFADISVHFVYAWVKGFRGVDSLFDAATFPKSLEWLARLTAYLGRLKQSQPPVPKISAKDAAARIAAGAFEPYDIVGFDTREAARLGLKLGDEVSIAPDDTGRNFGTPGKLVALNREEFVVETKGTAGLMRCHFPRIMFTAKVASKSKL